jgi:hypothetical protein
MPGILIKSLIMALATTLGAIVGRVITGLGIGFLAYQGVDILIGNAQSYINAQMGTLPATLSQVVTLTGLPTALNMMFSALAARWGTGTVYRFAARRA